MNPSSNGLPPVQDIYASIPGLSTDDSSAPATNTHLPSGMPEIADDIDLIEKEWVDKAKQILLETKDNPFVMNQQINAMKADYLKKRYDKDVKA